ncbi:sensor histidine kinase [Paenibacillus sp. NPDC058174]|uniref:sensor histidine kinase n=1 Tax=Paenibacillus sp. NPDC058174 TaxID=3346366 RepID=UPI0036DA9B95
MKASRSVRYKFVFGFIVVLLPLVFFLFYNNYYAMNVVRDQVSRSNANLLRSEINQIDNTLKQTLIYLYRIATQDQDVMLLGAYLDGSDDYNLTKQRIFNQLSLYIGLYNIADSMFIYNSGNGNLILSTQGNYKETTDTLQREVPSVISRMKESPSPMWRVIPSGSGYAMIQLIQAYDSTYVGALIQINENNREMAFWKDEIGKGFMMNGSNVISHMRVTGSQIRMIAEAEGEVTDKPYLMVSDSDTDEKFLLLRQRSEMSDLSFNVMVPEKEILAYLPFFQRAMIIIPIATAALLVFYLVFMQRVFFRPMSGLINGMNRIATGQADVRIKPGKSREFAFISSVFNHMSSQIERLKIDVYEEQLRVQQVEFKRLQMQINPHFYLNTLNIIHSLAGIKDFLSVQKMSLYLADYFRFTILNQSDVSIEEEIQHITNYLNIQSIRFPDHLDYDVSLEEAVKFIRIPPLTLQPFVENSIIHGITKKKKKFTIHISGSIRQENDDRILIMTITDNGVGMDDQLLQKLNQLQQHDSFSKHIGIWNVRHRLQMRFGEQANVIFAHAYGGGTEVVISLPILQQGIGEDSA